MNSRWIRRASLTLRSAVVVAALLSMAWLCLPQPPPLNPTSYSQRVFARDGQILRVTLSADE